MKFYFWIIFFLVFFQSLYALQRGISRVEIKTPAGDTVGLYEESHALVIGVSDYTNGWPTLPGVRKDVKAVKSALESHGFNVETALNPKDYLDLDKTFNSFISKHGRQQKNRLLFYFAGHGHTLKNYGEEMGYIIPTNSPNPNRDINGFLDSSMDMQQIEVYAKRIRSKHALFIFDSCFSGSIFALSRAIPENISYKTAKPVRQFITSGSAEEQVPDKSIFRRQFVAALDGEGDLDGDRYITAIELGEYLQKTVVNYSKSSQHPQYGKIRNPNLDKGDFVFALPKKEKKVRKSVLLPKKKGDFSISDLDEEANQEETARAAWSEQLNEMQLAINQVRSYDNRDVSPGLKVKAWRRFLVVFSEDNPFSSEDENLRNEAHNQIANWQAQLEQQESEKKRLAEAKRKEESERKKLEKREGFKEEKRKQVALQPKPNAMLLPIMFYNLDNKVLQDTLNNHMQKEISTFYELLSEKELRQAMDAAVDGLSSENCSEVACIKDMGELLDVEYTFSLEIVAFDFGWNLAVKRLEVNGVTSRVDEFCKNCSLTKLLKTFSEMMTALRPGEMLIQREKARLRIESTPRSVVFLVGHKMGKTPLDLSVEANTPLDIFITAEEDGFHDFIQEFTLKPGDLREIHAKLTRK